MSIETTLGRENIYDGKILKLYRDEVRMPDGKTAAREIIEHSGGVAILASPDGENILLVRQYRHAVGEEVLELPAGKLERGESPAECALRELEEETGFRAETTEELGRFYASPGYTSELLYLYSARGLVQSAQSLDEDEFLSVVQMPLSEALAACRDGRIKDAKTALALLLLENRN